MRKVVVNGKVVDFLQAATARHRVAPGCSAFQVFMPKARHFPRKKNQFQYRNFLLEKPPPPPPPPPKSTTAPDPCDRRPCRHGRCRRTDPEGPEAGRPPGYRCHCHQGYTGNHCDIRGDVPQRKTIYFPLFLTDVLLFASMNCNLVWRKNF